MVERKEYLGVPGPTPIPTRIINAMSQPIIYHRSQEFGKIISETIENGRKIFKTDGEILIFTASGRGVMEATIVNTVSPGEKILVLVNGKFGEIFAEIAQSFRAKVEILNFRWGETVDIKCFEKYLKNNREIKVVFVIHCETSTGVVNNVEKIGKICAKYGVLSVVDAVSSLGGIEISMDSWDIDFILGASQKALMTPPGLGLVAINPKSWQVIEKSTNSRHYWDFRLYREFQSKSPKQTPFTSSISLIIGLNEALKMINEEGIDNCIKRHREVAFKFRQEIKKIGLELFPKEENWCSNTVTAIKNLKGLSSYKIIKDLLESYNIRVADGLGEFKGKMIRVGHMGYQADHSKAMKIIHALKKIIG
jgi:aspartate aminotransferase-like enzyme